MSAAPAAAERHETGHGAAGASVEHASIRPSDKVKNWRLAVSAFRDPALLQIASALAHGLLGLERVLHLALEIEIFTHRIICRAMTSMCSSFSPSIRRMSHRRVAR